MAIELGLSCRNLIDADVFSKSDPMVVMYTQGLGSKEWREFGRTETIWNNLNPDFVKKFIIDYFFEERQAMRFDVYDVDSKSPDLSKHDFLGQVFCSLGEVVIHGTCNNQRINKITFPHRGTSSRNTGRIVIMAEELDSSKDIIRMKFNGRKLDKKDLFGKSDPFMVFCRCNENNSFTVCHKTEVKKNTLNPEWQLIEIPVRTLCNGDHERTIKVTIDFTASNGNPNQPSSLHYIHPHQPNQYALAIQAVGEIVQDYDSDKLFPTFGFGARLPPDGRVSHEFALNFNPANPNCFGIQGVMEAYQSSIRSVQLYGPTNFSPIINQVSRIAAGDTSGSQYYILLMITDGVISDMEATKEAIVNAARLPMSIIIVGVGPAEFDAMEELDGDTVRLSYRGIEAERDIVQFVPFRDYVAQGKSQILSQARLSKDVLAEIPDQLVGYMKSRNIQPGPPPPTYTQQPGPSAP
uniref:C2 domain-containing protein n=1 Tax=Ciona intestinalis TaxID=7719 RepID=F6WJF4_CIOIN